MKNKLIVKENLSNEEKFFKLEKYVDLIEKWNKKINLTGFSGDQIWKDGILESIFYMESILINSKSLEIKNKNWVDIGSGAGFPVIIFAVMYPEINFHIIESNLKRIKFLNIVCKELNLKIKIHHERVEEYNDAKFDIISARAVAELMKLTEYFKKLSKKTAKGFFIKGPKVFEEIKLVENKKVKIVIFPIEKITDKKMYIAKMSTKD